VICICVCLGQWKANFRFTNTFLKNHTALPPEKFVSPSCLLPLAIFPFDLQILHKQVTLWRERDLLLTYLYSARSDLRNTASLSYVLSSAWPFCGEFHVQVSFRGLFREIAWTFHIPFVVREWVWFRTVWESAVFFFKWFRKRPSCLSHHSVLARKSIQTIEVNGYWYRNGLTHWHIRPHTNWRQNSKLIVNINYDLTHEIKETFSFINTCIYRLMSKECRL